MSLSLQQKLDLRKQVDPETGCWLWTGARDWDNYGRVRKNNVLYLVHRVSAYLSLNFDLDSELYVLHKCDNPPCFNPDHLYIGTQAKNLKDMHDRKKKCINGHDLVSGNIVWDGNQRRCKTCRRLRRKKEKKINVSKD